MWLSVVRRTSIACPPWSQCCSPRAMVQEACQGSIFELELGPVGTWLDRCRQRALLRRAVFRRQMILQRRVFVRVVSALWLVDFRDRHGIFARQSTRRLLGRPEVCR